MSTMSALASERISKHAAPAGLRRCVLDVEFTAVTSARPSLHSCSLLLVLCELMHIALNNDGGCLSIILAGSRLEGLAQQKSARASTS